MVESIQYFSEVSIKVFEELQKKFYQDPSDIASYILGLTEELHNLGVRMIKESLEEMDQMINESAYRKCRWNVERHTKKKLVTSLGEVDFTKTLFRSKETGEAQYLIDRLLELESHERMTEDAKAKMLEEAVQTSYRRGGEGCSLGAEVSKQTVKNHLHALKFPETYKKPERKKAVDYLYIDADEDHVALQFRKVKGDLIDLGEGRKDNTQIVKMVYVYESIESDAPKSTRYHLVNPHYFLRVCSDKENEAFWDEIYHYLDAVYDLDKVKKIYLNSDGGGWIKTGKEKINGLVHVLDGFHLEQRLIKLTSHMLDSQEDIRSDMRKLIRKGTKKEFLELAEDLESYLPEGRNHDKYKEHRDYILNNWSAARIRLKRAAGILGSSTEGHVYHALSVRMSTDPMGWSVHGASQMARLREYYMNGGDMLELVRYQKEVLPMAAGAEEEFLSAADILQFENKYKYRRDRIGKYVDSITHSVSDHTRKQAWFKGNLWGL